MPTIRVECHNDEKNQHKYWEITTDYQGIAGQALIVYGRLPGYGRSPTARYAIRPYVNQTWLERKLMEKFRKGYTRIGEESVVSNDTELKTEKLESQALSPDQVMGLAKRLSRM